MKVKMNRKNIAKLVATLGLTGAIALGTISAGPYINPDTHFVDFYYIDTKDIHLDNQDFYNRFNEIYKNSVELQEQWDIIYPELSQFLLEYGDKLDQEQVLDTLSNLKFVIAKRDEGSVLAMTNYKKNEITYNERLFTKKPEQIKELKLHEAFHFLFQQNFYGSFLNFFDIGRQLDEGTADILTKESDAYAGVTVYGKNSNYVKVLCEIIGADHYLDAAGSHDWLKLIDYISEYCSKGDAKKLLKSIDRACVYYDDKGTDDDIEAWKIINKMYENKNGYTIEDSNDEIMKVYSNSLLDTRYKITGARSYVHAVVNKRYFLGKTEPTSVTFSQMGKKYGEITLNIDNSFATGKVLENEYFDENGNIVDKDSFVDFDNYDNELRK